MCDIKKDTIVYTSFPSMNDLRCVICEIDFIEVRDSSSKSNFHWKTMKCRLLIHLISDVIASPVSGTETLIFVIANKKFFDTGKLERILRNFKLVYRGLRPVNDFVYKSCLIYTIQTKIAPLWNKVGEYFVQGKEFYNFIGGAKALQLDILTEDTNICLKLHAERIKISYIKLEDYLPSSVISQFLADPKGYINLSLYNFPFIYVLPSTKKGKLLSVFKEIPSKYPFKDYDQLRRHWKNMYGYSLPKHKDGILYYEIKFLMPKSNIFIYPSLCIISSPVDIIPNRDKEPTITEFLSDMLIKLPVVCNKQLKVSKDTPFNTTLGNTSSLVDTLLKNTELNVHSPKNNITSSAQLEFSTKYVNELTKNSNKVSTLLKTHLATIHQLHNIPISEDTNTNLNIENTEGHPNVLPAKKKLCVENIVSKELNDNFTSSKEIAISKYFPIQKPHSSNTAVQEKQKQLSLKEKLLNAKSNEPDKIQKSTLEIDENINIEAMARNNQLHQLQNNVLSNWLQQHSIPHKPKGKKTELINKILSHIKNTQVLHQFRM